MPSTSNCGQQKTGAIHYSNANVVAHYMKRSVTLSCRTFMFNTILAYLIEVQDERRTGEREDRSEGRKKRKKQKFRHEAVDTYKSADDRFVCTKRNSFLCLAGSLAAITHSSTLFSLIQTRNRNCCVASVVNIEKIEKISHLFVELLAKDQRNLEKFIY